MILQIHEENPRVFDSWFKVMSQVTSAFVLYFDICHAVLENWIRVYLYFELNVSDLQANGELA